MVVNIKKLCLVFLITYAPAFSQDLIVDQSLIPYVEEVAQDANRKGFDIRGYLIKTLDSIKIDKSIEFPRLGVVDTVGGKTTIRIAPYVAVDTLMMRFVVWHEIGHVLLYSGEHYCYSCQHLMAETTPDTFAIFYKEEDWNLFKDLYWDYIIEQNNKN